MASLLFLMNKLEGSQGVIEVWSMFPFWNTTAKISHLRKRNIIDLKVRVGIGISTVQIPQEAQGKNPPKTLRLQHRNTSINISGWCENWQSSTEMSGKQNHHSYHLSQLKASYFSSRHLCTSSSIKGKGLMIRWFCIKEIYLNVLSASRSSQANLDFPQQMDGLGTYIFFKVPRTWMKNFNIFESLFQPIPKNMFVVEEVWILNLSF